MTTIAAISSAVGASAYAILLVLLVFIPRTNHVGRLLVAVCVTAVLWLGLGASYYYLNFFDLNAAALQQFEILRDIAWIAFFARLLTPIGDPNYRRRLTLGISLLILICAGNALLLALSQSGAAGVQLNDEALRKAYFCASLIVALGTLVLIEQVFRNSARNSRWALKHLCFGVGVVFVYDFYLYADAVLFNRIDVVLWSARGAVNALAVPMIAISLARNRQWDLAIFISRQVVFHAVVLVAAGVYLMAMAAVGYYIQAVGGQWGRALSTAFFGAAILLLLTLIFSTQMRSSLRLFLAKHFYRNKYEYGEEWLKFTQALTDEPQTLDKTILTAICDIVDSPGGVIWRPASSGSFAVAATLGTYDACTFDISPQQPFLARLRHAPAICDLFDEVQAEAGQHNDIPPELLQLPRVALFLPSVHGANLLAVLALALPRTGERFGWEDLNLLRTVAQQAASYLALVDTSNALSEAQQFEAFNRLSAFLVHDLKNLAAQLSLIENNAKRHRNNPEFVDDAFKTVADAVAKINRMLNSLRNRQVETVGIEAVNIKALVTQAIRDAGQSAPHPELVACADEIRVMAAREPLVSVVKHLLQNAIEATPADGRVSISIEVVGAQVHTAIADTGCGMDREFVHNRLFKPFDTTKGKAGMGIGAFESRHFIASMHGELRVASQPGAGTTFTIVLPWCDVEYESEEQRAAGL